MKLPRSTEYELCPAGTHVGVCSRIIDIGTQASTYMGKDRHQRKVLIEWQIPSERQIDDHAAIVSKRYTLSASDRSNLRCDLESWRGKRFTDEELDTFDMRTVLGACCLLSIMHADRDGKTYANVDRVTSMPRGMERPPLEGEPVYLSLEPEKFEPNVFDSLSDRLKAVIALSPEYKALAIGTSIDRPREAAGGSDDPQF